MSHVPVPPRASSKDFGEKNAPRIEAEKTRREAQRSTNSVASWESADYWTYRKEEAEASLIINDIDCEIAKETTGTDDTKYLKRKAELEEEREAAERKIRRYKARAQIVQAAKTNNPVSMRASYLELVMSLLSKTSRKSQGSFIRDLKEKYGAKKVEGAKWVWSPVEGDWADKRDVKAAHVFPLSFGQETMTYIFGEEVKGELNMASNGLFLPGSVEGAFDNHQVIIVPCETETKPQEWRFLVLDRGGLWKTPLKILGPGCTFADLHGRQLAFEPNHPFRPRARYLYFHYVMAILRLGRAEKQRKAGVTRYMPELTAPAVSRVWAMQGRYLSQNIMRAFIEGIGHEDTTDEADEMLSHAMDELPNETARMVETAKQMRVESDESDSSDDD